MEIQNTPQPPPPPEYYVLKEGQILGPYSIDELRAALADKRIAFTDFVQTGGLAIWRPMSRVLGVEGSMPYGAIAPDWRSILTWAWLRLRYDLDEQSLPAGLICFGLGVLALALGRFSFIMWLPWFLLSAVAAVALIRRRHVLLGSALLIAICAVPAAQIKHHLGSRGMSALGKSPGPVAQSDLPPDTSPVPFASQSNPPASLLSNDESRPLAESRLPGALPFEEPPPLLPREPGIDTAARDPATTTPPPLISVTKPPEAVAVPAAVETSVTTQSKPAIVSGSAGLPPPLSPPALAPVSPAPPGLKVPELSSNPADDGDIVQRHRDSLVVIRDREGSGSGFLCKKGERVWLFTNNHVAAGMRQPVFSGIDGTRITVGAAEAAAGYDVMRFALAEPPVRPLDSVTDLQGVARIGDDVVVLGNSGGGGVVTKITGKLVGIGPDRIEVSAEFIPGNSGSPIIHVPSGKVIGIATYLTRRYEEFSAGGDPPQGPGATKPPGLRGQGTVVTRRFGFRLDNVPKWEPVNWQVFQSEAEQLRQISAVTEDIFDFLAAVRQRQAPQFGTDTLRRPGQQWLDTVRKPRLSEVDKLNATHSFLNSLRFMVRTDVTAAEARLRYSYFRDRLTEEKTVRDKLYQAFDSEARRMASPSTR